MADKNVEEAEVTKDVLAPAEGPREDLINTAVKFLKNPKVLSSSLTQKKAFLERKGLTREEVEAAIQRSGIEQNGLVPTVHAVPAPHPIGPLPVSASSKWSHARNVLSTAVLVSGLSYAVYKLYQEFIKPVVLGKPRPSARIDRVEKSVEELQTSIVQTLAKVQETLSAVQGLLTEQQEKVQTLSHELYSRKTSDVMARTQDNQLASEVKNELTSIKGLLLNRRQFPSAPQITPVLPSWQLSTDSVVLSPTTPDQKGDAAPADESQFEKSSSQDGTESPSLTELNSNNKGVNEFEEDTKPQITYSETSSAINPPGECGDHSTKDSTPNGEVIEDPHVEESHED